MWQTKYASTIPKKFGSGSEFSAVQWRLFLLWASVVRGFFQNPNKKLQRFLPYHQINFQNRNLCIFWLGFWKKWWPHKVILNLTDLYIGNYFFIRSNTQSGVWSDEQVIPNWFSIDNSDDFNLLNLDSKGNVIVWVFEIWFKGTSGIV